MDYYRVGRKIAYPLPLPELVIPEVLVPSIAVYPWATWLLWTLEERIDCLGWTAQWFGDEQARLAATADLAALARWPTYQQYTSPDLSSAHAGRILWTASTRWGWLNDDLRRSVREACVRHVEACCPPRTSFMPPFAPRRTFSAGNRLTLCCTISHSSAPWAQR